MRQRVDGWKCMSYSTINVLQGCRSTLNIGHTVHVEYQNATQMPMQACASMTMMYTFQHSRSQHVSCVVHVVYQCVYSNPLNPYDIRVVYLK